MVGTGVLPNGGVTQAGVGLVSVGRSTLAVDQSTMTADDMDSTTVTVTVLDAARDPMEGVTVTLAVSGTGNTVTQPVGTTDSAGECEGSFTTDTAGVKVVTAVAGGRALALSASVTAEAP